MKAIIIEDEKMARQLLRALLRDYCPKVEVIEDCEDLSSGVRAIKKHKPDLVFLDIEMPGMSGIHLLDFFNEDEIDFSIIFVTAYNDYAIQAFKLSAIDYILKPINKQLLVDAVNRFEKITEKKIKQIEVLKQNLSVQEDKKIVIPNKGNSIFVNSKDILYIGAEGAYSVFHMSNGKKHMLSRNLKYVEEMINGISYLKRCHKSYILNTNCIQSFSKQNYMAMLNNAEQIPVSTEKVSEIFV